MANLQDLENRLHTIAEAEKNGGILDIPTEAIQILAMCNSIRIEMINEMCEGIDPEQCDEQLFIQLVSNRTFKPTSPAVEDIAEQLHNFIDKHQFAKIGTFNKKLRQLIADTLNKYGC